MSERQPEPEPAPDPRLSFAAGGCLYAVLFGTALLWLWWRERLPLLQVEAIGRHGPWLAAAVGLATGLLGAAGLAAASRRSPSLRAVEARARSLFLGMGDSAMLPLVLVGAVAEEVFFRLAVQDALGLPGSVAAYVLMNTTAGWAWLPLAALHATVLGLLLQQGFGLLATTTAHAILNYLSLRRILSL